MNDVVISMIRTAVPLVVGAILAWLAARGLDLGSAGTALIPVITAAITAAYYGVVRIAESRWPWLGVLLGHTAKPSYGKQAAKPEPVKRAA